MSSRTSSVRKSTGSDVPSSHPDEAVISDISARLTGLLSAPLVGWRPILRGYTPALRGVATLADGTTAFVKLATNDLTAEWLRIEHRIYRQLPCVPYRAQLVSWRPHPLPALALEDLSSARWPPPWQPGDVTAVRAALASISVVDLPDLPPMSPSVLDGWSAVASDPTPLLGLGLVSPSWLRAALPRLQAAASQAPRVGDAVLHFDVRSDNLCLRPSGACLIDWNYTCRGDARLDVAFWSASLRAEGGPQPETQLGEAPELAAAVSGFFAGRAGLPVIPQAPLVRRVQQEQLASALPWAIRALGLPAADGPRAGALVD
jgi:hypothetical protein